MNDVATLPANDARIPTALDVARAFAVIDAATFTSADNACVELLQIKKEVLAKWSEPKKKAADAHKAICAMEQSELGQIDEVRTLYKQKMDAWKREQEAKRLELEAIAREQAKKAAEEAALRVAGEVEKQGGSEAASSVLNKMIQAAPVVHVESSVPKAATKLREHYEIDTIDWDALPDQFWIPDEKTIASIVRSKKDKHGIPGVTVRVRTI